MSVAEREKWDARYAEPGYRMGDGPSDFLVAASPWLPTAGLALDLACGEGQTLVWMARRGLVPHGVDISPVGLHKARRLAAQGGVRVELEQADLEDWDPGDRTFALVTCTHFLLRDLVPRIRRAVAPGGTVAMELLAAGTPCNPRYLVEPNELLRWFVDWRVGWYAEPVHGERHLAQLVATRPL